MTISLRRIKHDSKKETITVNISIIIAARNEEENIKSLVDYLKKLDYPTDMLEIILVDDNSIDRTFDRWREETESLPYFKILKAEKSGMSGKRDALTLGIKSSMYPFILITDADCHPEKDWLKFYSNKFTQGYDMVFGIAPFYEHKNLVNKVSCFENLKNSILSFSMASINLPISASARSFGFSKSAFYSIGGYEKTKDSISGDDDLLLREAINSKLRIGAVTEPGSFVFSNTKKTFSDYFRQKARHTQSSFYYLKKHQLILGFWHSLNLCFVFSPILMFINPLFGILLPAKLLIDISIVKSTQIKFSYSFSMIEIIYLQLFYEVFLIIHFLNAGFRKIKWK